MPGVTASIPFSLGVLIALGLGIRTAVWPAAAATLELLKPDETLIPGATACWTAR